MSIECVPQTVRIFRLWILNLDCNLTNYDYYTGYVPGCLASSFSEKYLDIGIRHYRYSMPQVLGGMSSILEFHIVIQENVYHHCLEFINSEEPTWTIRVHPQ